MNIRKMNVTSRERRVADYFIEIDGKSYDLEGIIEDLTAVQDGDVRFHADPRGTMYLEQEVLSSLGGREYPCSQGPKFEKFLSAMKALLIQGKIAHHNVKLSEWVNGYTAGRKASMATYTVEEHRADVQMVLSRLPAEKERAALYEARMEVGDPPYQTSKPILSDFWKVAVSVPRARLPSACLDGSGMGQVTVEEIETRLLAEIEMLDRGEWSWP
jgi:hypothetical protein